MSYSAVTQRATTALSTTSTITPPDQSQQEVSSHPSCLNPDIMATTMNDIPGYKIIKVLGTVYGLTVRTRNIVASTGMAFKGLAGGELKWFTTLLYNARNDAAERMNKEVIQRGGNAVIAMRFETNELGGNRGFVQVAAYGTAAIVEKAEEDVGANGKGWDTVA